MPEHRHGMAIHMFSICHNVIVLTLHFNSSTCTWYLYWHSLSLDPLKRTCCIMSEIPSTYKVQRFEKVSTVEIYTEMRTAKKSRNRRLKNNMAILKGTIYRSITVTSDIIFC